MVKNLDFSTFHTALHRWYATHGRKELPWRNTDDPYHIYLSEVMLQQTQVKTVLERFYFPFLERFPDLTALAAASEEAVLKAWEGLGYYSRARNLHKAAKLAAARNNTPPLRGSQRAQGENTKKTVRKTVFSSNAQSDLVGGNVTLPNTIDALMELPGIGKNTAHAIAAFAFHQPVPIMEANLKRVLCRIFALKTPTDNELWDAAEQLLDKDKPFDYNQAMMDIGATVCTPKAPACLTCPANEICAGKDAPEAYPQKKVKKATPIRRPHILMVEDIKGALYMTPRTTKFLGGMYHFIELPEGATEHTLLGQRMVLDESTEIGAVTHTYSHFKLDALVYYYKLEIAGNGEEWIHRDTIKSLPLSGADKKVLSLKRF